MISAPPAAATWNVTATVTALAGIVNVLPVTVTFPASASVTVMVFTA